MSTSTSGRKRCSTIEELIEAISESLRRALVVRFGIDVGVEAHAEVVAYMCEHRSRALSMDNPAGYLFRVGQSSARRLRRWNRSFQLDSALIQPASGFTPELLPALAKMRPRHRVAVVLVHGYGFSYAEVASILNVTERAIRNDVHRGLVALPAGRASRIRDTVGRGERSSRRRPRSVCRGADAAPDESRDRLSRRGLIAVIAVGASVAVLAVAARHDTQTPTPTISSASSDDTSKSSTEVSSAAAGLPSPPSIDESGVPIVTPSTAQPPTSSTALATPITPGDTGPDVTRLQERLGELHFEPGPVDGVYGTDTEQAMWAFKQLVLETPRDKVTSEVTNDVWEVMQQPLTIASRRALGQGTTHVEIYLPEQVLVVFTDDQAALIAHISTGSGQDYCETVSYDTDENGSPLSVPTQTAVCATAKTPPGVFNIYSNLDGTRMTPIGSMTNPVYFNDGIAIAGSAIVPLRPSSHGEVRINRTIAATFPNQVHLHDSVLVWGDDGRQPEEYSKDESLPSFNLPDPSATTEPPTSG